MSRKPTRTPGSTQWHITCELRDLDVDRDEIVEWLARVLVADVQRDTAKTVDSPWGTNREESERDAA